MVYEAKFDPGFSTCLTSFSGNIELFYQELNSISIFKQKKNHFTMFFVRISRLIDAHVGFYVGCMLWAGYLKSLGSEKIIGNEYLNEKYDEKMFTDEVNYILNFVQKFDKDAKYYMGKSYKFDENKKEVLEKYINFLIENKAFVNTDTTDKIIISENLSKLSKEELEKIAEKIFDVIHSTKLEELIEFCDKI